MSEGQDSAEGETRTLPARFLVATQNPVEFHGTYPLSEAQLDRFGIRLSLGCPPAAQEVAVLFSQVRRHPVARVAPVLSPSEALCLLELVRLIRVEERLAASVVFSLAEAAGRRPDVRLARSPRGTLVFFRAARARAVLEGSDHAEPEDVRAEAVPVLCHRLGLKTKARCSGVCRESIVVGAVDGAAFAGRSVPEAELQDLRRDVARLD